MDKGRNCMAGPSVLRVFLEPPLATILRIAYISKCLPLIVSSQRKSVCGL